MGRLAHYLQSEFCRKGGIGYFDYDEKVSLGVYAKVFCNQAGEQNRKIESAKTLQRDAHSMVQLM